MGQARKAPKAKKAVGELLFCGLGLDRPREITLATLEALRSCDVAFYLHGDGPQMKGFLEPLCGDVRLLFDPNQRAVGDAETTRRAADQVCAEVERGRRVAYVTYGHPSLYSDAENVSLRCRERGYGFRVLPAVSAVDGVLAALHASGAETATSQGVMACLADRVLDWAEPGRRDLTWILLGVDRLVRQGRYADLCAKLESWYPASHPAYAVRCAEGGDAGAFIAGAVADLRSWQPRVEHMMSLALAPRTQGA